MKYSPQQQQQLRFGKRRAVSEGGPTPQTGSPGTSALHQEADGLTDWEAWGKAARKDRGAAPASYEIRRIREGSLRMIISLL